VCAFPQVETPQKANPKSEIRSAFAKAASTRQEENRIPKSEIGGPFLVLPYMRWYSAVKNLIREIRAGSRELGEGRAWSGERQASLESVERRMQSEERGAGSRELGERRAENVERGAGTGGPLQVHLPPVQVPETHCEFSVQV
jgi:hypothetical protein